MADAWLSILADSAARRVKLWRTRPLREALLAARAGGSLTLAVTVLYLVSVRLQSTGLPSALATLAAVALAVPLVTFASPDMMTNLGALLGAGMLARRISIRDVEKVVVGTVAGNLAGIALCAFLVHHTGLLRNSAAGDALREAAAVRSALPWTALVTRGLLCQWVVSLSGWMARRAPGPAVRYTWSFWGVYAFLSAGLEMAGAHIAILLMGGAGTALILTGAIVLAANLLGGAVLAVSLALSGSDTLPSDARGGDRFELPEKSLEGLSHLSH